jgi:hypothetical protein
MSIGYLLEMWDIQCQPGSRQAVRDAIAACFTHECVICEHRDDWFLFVSILLRGGIEPCEHAESIAKAIAQVDQSCSFRLRYYPIDGSEEFVVDQAICQQVG